MLRSEANTLKAAARVLSNLDENELAHRVAKVSDPFHGRRLFPPAGMGAAGELERAEEPEADLLSDIPVEREV